MKIKKAILIILLGTSLSTQASACDICAEKAIKLGFEAIKKVIESLSSSVDGLSDTVDSLKDQISDSTDANVDSVNDFSDNLKNSIDSSTKQISKSVSGLVSTIDVSSKISQKMTADLALSIENHITATARNTLRQIIAVDDMYRAGGVFGHFPDGNAITGLFFLLDSNQKKIQTIYVKHSAFVNSWNQRKSGLGADGRGTVLNATYQNIMLKSDSLLMSLTNGSVLTSEEYKDLLMLITLGFNKDQLPPSSPDYLFINARQSEVLFRILMKAPIIDISEENLSALSSVLLQTPLPYDQCPSDEIRDQHHCTSVINIIESLVYRPTTPDYANKLAMSSERALLEELNRAMIVSNILTKYTNNMRGQHEITQSLSN